jgi:hypothetical protein
MSATSQVYHRDSAVQFLGKCGHELASAFEVLASFVTAETRRWIWEPSALQAGDVVGSFARQIRQDHGDGT